MVVIIKEQIAQREAENTELPRISELEGQLSKDSHDSSNPPSSDLNSYENTKLTLVLMAGLPGAGKSTLASELSRDLQWHVIEKDRYKQAFLEKGLEDEEAARLAYNSSFDTTRRMLIEQQTSVILDSGALHNFILENATDIVCSVTNVQLKVILCVVDRDLRNERLRKRPWPVVVNITVDPATIAGYLQCFKHLPPNTLTLYTDAPLEESLAIAREYLGHTKNPTTTKGYFNHCCVQPPVASM